MSKIILTNREIHCLDVTIRTLTTVSWMITQVRNVTRTWVET